jgi:hypothetical protein
MATNEELAIAFLCLATRQQQNDLLEFVRQKYSVWFESDTGRLFQEAVNLPFSEIPRKIAKLGVSLYTFEHRNSVYTWMADQCAAICAGARSPFPIPTVRRKDSHSDPNEWVMPLNLGPPQKQ